MSVALWAQMVYWVSIFAYWLWFLCCPREALGRAARRAGRAWARTIRAELRPFVLPIALASYIAVVAWGDLAGRVRGFDWLAAAMLAVLAVDWWRCRRHDDHDDRWRRRRRKAAARIRMTLGGRLAIDLGGA